MRRWAVRSAFALALLLLPAPGAFAATCTATGATGSWYSGGSWSCGAAPTGSDAVVIPAGSTMTIPAPSGYPPHREPVAASVTLRGALVLTDDDSTLDTSSLTASGGSISGPQSAVTVTLRAGGVATVDAAGMTLDGAALTVTGAGGLAVAGPLTIIDAGWLQSTVATSWSGTAPWTLGGGSDPSVASGFEQTGAQLTIAGATSAKTAAGAGDGVIEVDQGATLAKQDATTSTLAVDVLLDASTVQVAAGALIGGLQGNAALTLAAGATLGLSGDALQLSSAGVSAANATIEVEPSADIELDLPANPALRLLRLGAGASLDVEVGDDTGPVDAAPAPEILADETALADDATLSIDGGGGTLELAPQDALHGSGTLDGSLTNTGGTLSPSGQLHVTGDFAQAAGGTLALALRSVDDGDGLAVDGDVALAGTLRVTTGYAPAATASPLVLAAGDKPAGTFAKVVAPLLAGRTWVPAYGSSGVMLSISGSPAAAAAAAAALGRPTLRPVRLVVGADATCVPGSASAGRSVAYQWLRGGKPIRGAVRARRLVVAADRGRLLACRVTTTSGGSASTATSEGARARSVLAIASAVEHDGRTVAVTVHCAASERTCRGSLRVLIAGRRVAVGHFSLHAPGGVVALPRVGAMPIARGAVDVRAIYRNKAGSVRTVERRLALAG
ncbi:MAG TPA: hypothetical protein VGK92_04655 [Gaiellales bacterium]